jgi:hypothetical protein
VFLTRTSADIESDFGDKLDWQELPDGEGCRVRFVIDGGYKSPLDQWPVIQSELTDEMVKLDKAMRLRIAALTL